MARYSAVNITSQVSFGDAKNNLDDLSDDDLVARITWPMVASRSDVQERSWDRREPEFDDLPRILREQALADLNVLFMGYQDSFCEDFLAAAYSTQTGKITLTVLFDDHNEDDGYAHECDNPVNRLQNLRICDTRIEHAAPAETASDAIRAGLQARAEQNRRAWEQQIREGVMRPPRHRVVMQPSAAWLTNATATITNPNYWSTIVTAPDDGPDDEMFDEPSEF